MNDALPHIEVACGVLVDENARILIVERPSGKIAAGKWEFPGGKIEAGETPRAALDRELREELGVIPTAARPLICLTHRYSDRVVRLHTFCVERWQGTLSGREGQQMQWCDRWAPPELDLLPTVWPSLHAMRLPAHYVFTPPQIGFEALLEGMHALPDGALLRIRLPDANDADYSDIAARVINREHRPDLRILLDRGETMAWRLGAHGCHFRESDLESHDGLEKDSGFLRIASCHDTASLALARSKGFDATVLGSVNATPSHPGRNALGWAAFEGHALTANLPTYAIGGLGPGDLDTAFSHYAQGVAGISAYWSRSGS